MTEFVETFKEEHSKPGRSGNEHPIQKIREVADQYPYYKYCGLWSRHMENHSFLIILTGWLGMYDKSGNAVFANRLEGNLMTYEQVAQRMGGTSQCEWVVLMEVPTDEDDSKFHLSVEEYLHSIISLINELVLKVFVVSLMVVTTRSQFCYHGKLWTSASHQ